MSYLSMDCHQLEEKESELIKEYQALKAQELNINMTRGKPCKEQLDLSEPMLTAIATNADCYTDYGFDCRNYGLVDGLDYAKKMFSDIIGVPWNQIIVGGNSSLNLMFDYIAQAYSRGVCGGEPWCRQGKVKFLCPAPGYDRHFGVTEYFGIELLTVDMTPDGPDMEQVERLAADPLVKGIWCVPKYSNPDGYTYSDETVRRLAAMKTAPDFRIMWDNAYCLHHLTDTPDPLLNIYEELKKHGNEDRVVMFCSTSKISFPGAGVAALAASPANIADIKKRMSSQTIGYDKINMLRHVRYFRDLDGIKAHMRLHEAILRPKFAVVLDTLERRLAGRGVASWHKPNGGYFVSVNVMDGCAKETVRLLKEAGVVMTGAGATYPYGRDPRDANIRVAPTYPPLDELQMAMDLFCVCAELACVKKLLEA